MGQVVNGPGTQRDSYSIGLGHNGQGHSGPVGLGLNGTGTHWDWHSIGLGHDGSGNQ